MYVSVSTIPPRVRNGSLFKFIDSILNQSIEVRKIFINLPDKFQRFDQLTNEELDEIRDYDEKIQITFLDYDSPVLKYIGALKFIEDDALIFIGDDDQIYHQDLLRKMKMGMFDKNAVYQNRFHIVKHGTAGIIHGFCGLMMNRNVFKYLDSFKFPTKCFIDDQLMSIYFFLNKINIYPSIVNDFCDIYQNKLNNEMESVGDGALSNMKLPRRIQIRELEKLYGVFFLKKNSNKGQGKLKYINTDIFDKKLNFHYTLLDPLTKAIKNNIETLSDLYPTANFNFHTCDEFSKRYPKVKLSVHYLLNYYSDKFGSDIINKYPKEQIHIYINRNLQIKKDFDIYEYLLNNENIFYKDNIVEIIKNNIENNFL